MVIQLQHYFTCKDWSTVFSEEFPLQNGLCTVLAQKNWGEVYKIFCFFFIYQKVSLAFVKVSHALKTCNKLFAVSYEGFVCLIYAGKP